MMANGNLTLPGRKSLIKPVSTVNLAGLKLSRKLKAACITDGSGTPKGILILEDQRTAWVANDIEELKRLHDALGTMIAALEHPRGKKRRPRDYQGAGGENMPELHSRYIRGALAYWETHRMRLVDAIGSNVIKWELRPDTAGLEDQGATGTDPHGAVTTVVEAGAGTSEMTASKTAGYAAELVTAANENDGISVQFADENFEFTGDQDIYFGIEFEINDVTQSDFLVGLCITDTALLGGLTDGVYFESVDGGTGVSTVTEKDSSETQSDSEGTLVDATLMFLEFYWDGTSVYFFIDDAEVGIVTATVPDDEALRPSIEFLTGEAVAQTMKIRQARCIQIGR